MLNISEAVVHHSRPAVVGILAEDLGEVCHNRLVAADHTHPAAVRTLLVAGHILLAVLRIRLEEGIRLRNHLVAEGHRSRLVDRRIRPGEAVRHSSRLSYRRMNRLRQEAA